MSDSSSTDRRELEDRLVARATSDSAFRQRLVDDPHAAVKDELGVSLPADVSVTVLQESADRLYLVIPTADGEQSDLSDAELGAVAGGRADGTDILGRAACRRASTESPAADRPERRRGLAARGRPPCRLAQRPDALGEGGRRPYLG